MVEALSAEKVLADIVEPIQRVVDNVPEKLQ